MGLDVSLRLVEIVHPATGGLELVVRADGLRRAGNLPVGVPLQADSWIARGTAGAVPGAGLAHEDLAGALALLEPTATSGRTELGLHLAAVATF